MKYLLFTLEYPPFNGGVANYYGNMINNWPKSSEIDVLSNNNNKLINKNGPLRWWPAIFKLISYIRKNKPDYILVGHALPLGTVCFILSYFFSFKYVLFFHGLDFSMSTKVKRKKLLTKLILKKADKIISANSVVFKMINNFSDVEDKNLIVNPGINKVDEINQEKIEILRKKYQLTNEIILVSLGRLVKRKGFDKTILALKDLYNFNPNNNLVYFIVGSGPDETYLKELSKNYQDKIIFTGEASEEEKWTFLALADIFIMPSRNIDGDFEGFGIVYLEANLMNKPVIAGNSGGIKDAVIDGLNGLLVDPENEKEIAKTILKLSDNNELRKEMGEKGRQRALNEFLWANQAEKIHNFLNN